MKDRGEKRHIGTILSSFLMGTGLGILFAPRCQVVGLERKLRDWGEKPKGESGIFRKP